MQDLWRLPAKDIVALIRSKKFRQKRRPRQRLPGWMRSILPLTPSLTIGRQMVLAQAGAIDAAIAANEDVGPLAGVPVTVKVNIDQEGFATTNGLKLQRDVIAATNSPVIDNLRKAGAVILGRTNCPAFSYRWFTTNLVHGDTKNPRDPGITPGGSSGGAGAAVAAGIGHIAHGTDYRGIDPLIRPMPAAFMACGPTIGRIAAFNAALARTHDRAADLGGIRPARAHYRRSQDCARGDVRNRRARSLVGAGAAGRTGEAEAGRAVPSSRRSRIGRGSESRRRRCRQAPRARRMDGGRNRNHAAAARARGSPDKVVARRQL